MTFPSQSLNIVDPGPGTTAPPVTQFHVISGVSTGGSIAVNTPTSISDITKVRSLLGYGPLAEDVAYALQEFGGPVIAVLHNVTGSALTNQALTATGTSPPVVLVSGIPNDEYAIQVNITKAGALGTSTFTYSLDGFNVAAVPATPSSTRLTPTGHSFLIPNTGLTLTFPTGTYAADNVYKYSVVPTIPQTADTASVATILESTTSLVVDLWLVSGTQASATVAGALAASLQGYLTTLTQSERYARVIIDIGSGDTEANVIAEALSWTGSRIDPCYGYCLQSSCLPYEGFSVRQVGHAGAHGVRAMRELISSDLSRTAAGPLDNVLAITFDASSDQTVDAVQISTMRTWSGKPGFYIANGKLKCAFGSNFTDMQYGRIMDLACLTTYNAQFPFVSATFRATSTGTVDPRDANSLVQSVQSALNVALSQPINADGQPGHVSSVTYSVNLTNNILSSQQLQTTVAIVSLGYAKTITSSLFFTVTPAGS